ncbi:DHS-like NAD/FAD-binding domain-containing protein [Basidiobolus meristosporus CBS 931.73]|uniref:DHS-like NAD/FAD-binding domain-containing protein n=1 Tax=Basidiobolus meristosporus CBS 931.73 TaxID=1314790 RepID=A0A1Y1YV08_9FUNG|nr:DHS-like NAD/FAD-binding domain-containing protein [Basidiobolus meristosporus CBS 931.73]|eukprot:ORY01868.1 DHS-like NAD/FAD-binding domain-containing protein [Basidiobolus meristosporus CBS 931.73]
MKSVTLNNLSESLETLTLTRDLLHRCKRCIVITGAGISVASGIPDFRSADGLFELLKHKYPKAIMSGRDLFDATLFKDPVSTQLFFHFMGEFKDVVGKAKYTRTHRFLKELDQKGKLLRCYTQNIDCLEKQAGLETDFDVSNKLFTRAVQLHGSMEYVVCTICHAQYRFTEKYQQQFKEGTAPPCPNCRELGIIRDIVGKRSKATGFLRPSIVLYNEHHPQGDHIGQLSAFDIRRNPDLLIIMGTSLKVSGIKKLVKEMAGRVHESKIGKVIYINRVPPTASEWGNIIDYHLMGDVDSAIDLLESDLKLALDDIAPPKVESPIVSIPVLSPTGAEKISPATSKVSAKTPSKCSKKQTTKAARQPLKTVNTNTTKTTAAKKHSPKKEKTKEEYVIVSRRMSPRQSSKMNSIPKIIIRKREVAVDCSSKSHEMLYFW